MSSAVESGDEAPTRPTFEAVYDAELSYVWNVLGRLGVADRDLADVAHDVFVVVHRRLATYDPARPLRPWLFGVAFRVASAYRRKAHRSRELLDTESVATEEPRAEAAMVAKQRRELVLEALEALGPDRRSVLVGHDLEAMPVPELARALSIPLNTAYSRLRLARADFTAAVRRIQARRGTP